MTRVLERPAEERDRLAERIAERMDAPVAVLGIVFLLVVLVDTVVSPAGALGTVFEIASWALWAVFALEFVLRAAIAPSTARFLRRNWWQLVFLVLPFLRFARVLARLRLARIGRMGRVLSSAVRSSRTAVTTLGSRLGWLSAVTVIVILAASQLLYAFAGVDSYADALHRAALATITGEPLRIDSGLAAVLEVVLALYSVVVFAALAGMLGAFFLERR